MIVDDALMLYTKTLKSELAESIRLELGLLVPQAISKISF